MNDLPSEVRFGTLLLRVARGWRREADRALQATGLSEAAALPLLVLSRSGDKPVRQGTLAEWVGVEGPSLVRLIDVLEAEGLVERWEDASDRRAKTLHLTPKGRQTADEIEAVMKRMRSSLIADIDAGDLDNAVRVLSILEDRLFADEEEQV